MAGAANVSKLIAETLLKNLQEEPYALSFGFFLLKTKLEEINKRFCKIFSNEAITMQKAIKNLMNNFTDHQVFHLFGPDGA